MGSEDDEIRIEMMPKLMRLMSCLLQGVAERNDLTPPNKMSVFHGLVKPSISIQRYLDRIFKYANCSQSCYIVAYVYLDRFTHQQPSFPINSYNVHRLLITSIMLSAKFMDDLYYNNAYYAKLGGISTREMNILEVDFLFGLGFNLNVSPTTFQTYSSYLHAEMVLHYSHLFHISEHPSLYDSEDESSHQQHHQLAV